MSKFKQSHQSIWNVSAKKSGCLGRTRLMPLILFWFYFFFSLFFLFKRCELICESNNSDYGWLNRHCWIKKCSAYSEEANLPVKINKRDDKCYSKNINKAWPGARRDKTKFLELLVLHMPNNNKNTRVYTIRKSLPTNWTSPEWVRKVSTLFPLAVCLNFSAVANNSVYISSLMATCDFSLKRNFI